jgi:chemotaxis protein MotB
MDTKPPQPSLSDLPPVRFVSGGLPRPLSDSHRGGAWKVAYADFVTALMALFIVLWLMGSSEQVKQSVSGYFRDPRGYTTKQGSGPANSGEGLKVDVSNVSEVRNQVERALRQAPEWQKIRDSVLVSVTGEGLRIDLIETEQGMFFVTGNATPTSAGERLLKMLGTEIAGMPNNVAIEGHTDARPFRGARPDAGYSNWELSVDRANTARRLLYQAGMRTKQCVEVRGFADEKLLNADDPNDARNRRVSVVVRFTE